MLIDKELTLSGKDNKDLLSLIQFETIDELVEKLEVICTKLSNLMNDQRDRYVKNQTNQFIDYIKKNFDDYSFSVQNMADYFQVHASNMSQYFINQTGESISDYVYSLRIEKTKKLLVETDDRIQDIVSQVGYVNFSSFVRKFKHETGITPGSYRNLFSKTDS